jgi:hypothetical protein
MNQPGWSNTNFFNDSLQIEKYISLGAKYLILTAEELKSRACLLRFMNKKIGEKGVVSVYRLK